MCPKSWLAYPNSFKILILLIVSSNWILRPEGSVIIRDDVDILVKVKSIVNGMDWDCQIVDHEDGPLEREKLLFAVKNYWTAPAASDKNS